MKQLNIKILQPITEAIIYKNKLNIRIRQPINETSLCFPKNLLVLFHLLYALVWILSFSFFNFTFKIIFVFVMNLLGLLTKEGEKSIYNLAKGRERKTRDLNQVKCIKDEEGRVLVQERDIKDRWKKYFHNLFNSNRLDIGEEDRNYNYYRRIQEHEVREALKRMSSGKAVGPDNIPIEVWKSLGDRGIMWLTKLFNEIMRTKKMPDEWRRSTLIAIYKNKEDIQSCANYRGIKLMSHTMKLWKKVIEQRIRKETRVTDNQFGFMPGRSTMEAIYLL